MAHKESKTIEEQLNILSSRGLTVNDETKAKTFLLENNYYRVSGYTLTLREGNVFSKSATFQQIYDIYNLDRELRNLLLFYIELIEIKMKSVYAYEFTKIYNPIDYLDSKYFTDAEAHKTIVNKAAQQIKHRINSEPYIRHFIRELNEELPLWAFVDLLTISNISLLYSITKERQIKENVAQAFGLKKHNKRTALLGKYMHSMTILRNLCAHGSRLYNRVFQQKPSLNKKEKELLIKNESGKPDNSHLYGFLFIMKRMLPVDSFNTFKSSLIELAEKYPDVDLSYLGFREDWKQTL